MGTHGWLDRSERVTLGGVAPYEGKLPFSPSTHHSLFSSNVALSHDSSARESSAW